MSNKKQSKAYQAKRHAELERKIALKRAQRQRSWRLGAIVVGSVAVVALLVWVIGTAVGDADESTEPDTSPIATAAAEPNPLTSGWGASPEPPDPAYAEDRNWTAVMETNQGTITDELDGTAAPQAVASFVELASDGFFDITSCHRLTTAGIFVLQCGDPLSNGTGGPSYRFGPIENAPADDLYPRASLAMPRQGGNAASMGSQFFFVYEDSSIPSDVAGGYTVFGTVTGGMDSVDAVAGGGVLTGGSDGPPALSVIFSEVSVS